MAFDPDYEAHREWLGYVQPVGLVVSPPALGAAAATVNRNIAATHREFLEWVNEVRLSPAAEPVRVVRDLPGLLQSVFQWQRADFVGAEGAAKLPETLEIPLTNYEETLRPTYAVPSVPADDGREVPPYQMLIQVLPTGTPLDELLKGERIHWECQSPSTVRATVARHSHSDRLAGEWDASAVGLRTQRRIVWTCDVLGERHVGSAGAADLRGAAHAAGATAALHGA